ncbi:MAG: hypothetical protein IT380_05320 [Myxococcales bacterium]|nr:hypothetical protein [Myxococcales bacterium]
MELEQVKQRARARQERLSSQPTEAAEVFRADAMSFFARVPEPPLYRRREDPARKTASGLLEEAELLLARGWRLGEEVRLHVDALEQHLSALCLTAEGRVEAAAGQWQRAMILERKATAGSRLWRKTDEERPRVFDEATRRSRYDPRPEPAVQVKLACPWCQKAEDFTLPPRLAMHRLTCLHCAQGFQAYLAEVKSVEVAREKGNRRRYTFRVEEPGGAPTRVEFEHVGGEELVAARRDLLAFLYGPPTILRGVLNLNSSRVLWLPSVRSCFVATAVFGEGAPELVPLRAFRDRVLLQRALGRAAVRWYYREGPGWARLVASRPWLKGVTRAMLSGVARAIERVL